MIQKITTLNNLEIDAKLVETYSRGKLFYAQERLVVTDFDNKEMAHLDVIELVTRITKPEVFELKELDINYTFEDPKDPDEDPVDPEPMAG